MTGQGNLHPASDAGARPQDMQDVALRDGVAGRHVRFFDDNEMFEILAQLPRDHLDTVLRHRYVPVSVAGRQSGCIVTDRRSLLAASIAGRSIIGWTRMPGLVSSVQALFGEGLARSAGNKLAATMPLFSAERCITPAQGVMGIALTVVLATAGAVAPVPSLVALTLVFSLLFLSIAGLRAASMFTPSPGARSSNDLLGDADLPDYSVLVPLFREVEVVDQLVDALLALDYPHEKLDIKLILEQEDIATRRHVARLDLPEHFELLIVPNGAPQTKPKALNYALNFARGSLLAIYDAEDIPEPDQLRRAASTFADAPESLACLQARLSFYNPEENWLTRQFTIEYGALFDLMLPMLAKAGLPLPLGGTSNHFRTEVLRRVGAWDPHNVTEDADLGLRLARLGWRVGVIESTTFEEANCQFANWLHQRARWLKGWMQTWLVHVRRPMRLWRELGPRAFFISQVMMLGMIATALLHPLFLGLVLWAAVSGTPAVQHADAVSAGLVGFGAVVLLAGYGFAIAAGARGLANRGLSNLSLALASMPVYWLAISIGGWLALWQLISDPHYWNKTAHGLSRLMYSAPRRQPPQDL